MYLAERVNPNLALQVQGDGSGLSCRAILAANNDDVREIDLQILDHMWPGDPIDLFSADSLVETDSMLPARSFEQNPPTHTPMFSLRAVGFPFSPYLRALRSLEKFK